MSNRYVVKCRFKDSNRVEYLDPAGFPVEMSESRPVHRFTLDRESADRKAREFYMGRTEGTGLASVSVVLLSRWPPYPEMAVITHYQYD